MGPAATGRRASRHPHFERYIKRYNELYLLLTMKPRSLSLHCVPYGSEKLLLPG